MLEGVEERPGYLGDTARRLADREVAVEAAYLATGTRAVLVVDDAAAAARRVLQEARRLRWTDSGHD